MYERDRDPEKAHRGTDRTVSADGSETGAADGSGTGAADGSGTGAVDDPGTVSEEEPQSDTTSRMGARRWTLTYLYYTPADYGVPPLPEWSADRTDGGGLAFAADDESEPFISAEDPVRVRR